MEQINYLVFVLIVSTIDQSFSAIHFELGKKGNPYEDYMRSRSASSHRGTMLTYSPQKRRDICNNLFPRHTQNQPPTVKKPPLPRSNPPQHQQQQQQHQQPQQRTIFKATIVAIGQYEIDQDDIFFLCVGYKTLSDGTKEKLTLSSAFRPGFMYSAFGVIIDDKHLVEIQGYVSMSPEYIELDHAELETRYVTIRRTLSVLERESPAYDQLFRMERDTISELAEWQLFLLCESVVSAPVYQQEGVKLVTNRSTYHTGIFYLIRKPVTFRDEAYSKERLTMSCVICKVRTVKGTTTNLYGTQSYDDKNSVYVFKVDDRGIIPDKYFINVPVLMNVRDLATAEDTIS